VAYGVVKGESEDKAVVSPVWTSTAGLSRGVGTSSCRGKSHTYGYLLYSPASFFQSNCLRGAKFIPVTHALPFIEKLRKVSNEIHCLLKFHHPQIPEPIENGRLTLACLTTWQSGHVLAAPLPHLSAFIGCHWLPLCLPVSRGRWEGWQQRSRGPPVSHLPSPTWCTSHLPSPSFHYYCPAPVSEFPHSLLSPLK